MANAVANFFRTYFTFNNVATVLGLILGIVSLLATKLVAMYFIIVMMTYIALLAILLAWREFTYSRKARYAEAMAALHQVSHAVRDAQAAIGIGNDGSFRLQVRAAVDAFSKAFSLVTGTDCRACIKTILVNEQTNPTTFLAEEFCRSSKGFPAQPKSCEIRDNSDFYLLFTYDRDFYLCNDLSKENPYNNTNWPTSSSARKDFFKSKKHSYISTIVWPIRAPAQNDQPSIIGFLCVDSLTRGIFEPRYDKDFGAVVADMLYNLLSTYRDWQSQSDETDEVPAVAT